jgi:hypothetical protein
MLCNPQQQDERFKGEVSKDTLTSQALALFSPELSSKETQLVVVQKQKAIQPEDLPASAEAPGRVRPLELQGRVLEPGRQSSMDWKNRGPGYN